MSFCLILRNLQRYRLGVLWALQWCGYSPRYHCLISRSCSSVQTFAVWLTSVHGSPQTTLPLANASDTNPCIRDLHPLDFLFNKRFCLTDFEYIYRSRRTHTTPAIKVMTAKINWCTAIIDAQKQIDDIIKNSFENFSVSIFLIFIVFCFDLFYNFFFLCFAK